VSGGWAREVGNPPTGASSASSVFGSTPKKANCASAQIDLDRIGEQRMGVSTFAPKGQFLARKKSQPSLI